MQKLQRQKTTFITDQLTSHQTSMRESDLVSSQAGFTLLELVLYIGIVTIILTALLQFAFAALANSTKSDTEEEVSSNARYIADRLSYEIRNAKGIVTPVSANQLTLQESDGKNTVISYTGSTLTLQHGSAPANSLNSTNTTLSSFTFKDLSSPDKKTEQIQFSFTMKANFSSTKQEYQQSVAMEGSAEVRSNPN